MAKISETLEAGYALSSVDLGIGLPPKVSATFLASDEVSAENVERLMTEHASKKLTLHLVRSLHRAWQLQRKITIVGLQPKGLSVEIGLSPSVTSSSPERPGADSRPGLPCLTLGACEL